jgi:hypothetical protein
MKLIDKANALSVFHRFLEAHVDKLDKKYTKLVKKSDVNVWDEVESLIEDIKYYEDLMNKVYTWMYNTYDENDKEHGV